jgi:RNA polymerase sigma factor (sigma-70 family)
MSRPDPPGDADASRAGNRPAGASRTSGGPPSSSGGPPSNEVQDFSGFYRAYFRRLFVYILYQGARADLAAELAQEAMITAYERWSTIQSPRSYVWAVAYRAYLRRALDDVVPVAEVPEPSVVLAHPQEAEEWLQQQEILDVLRALPKRQRQVLALRIDGWTPAEIADLIGIKPDLVRANLLKARRNAAEHRRVREGES